MKDNMIKTKIATNGVCTTYLLTIKCEVCGKEAYSNNPYAAKYCPDCKAAAYREKCRQRVAKHRHNKKLRDNGYL